MQIFIPTYGRSDNQVTWNNLPTAVKFDTKLVVQHREAGKYENYPTLILPEHIQSIGPTRQHLVDNYGPYIIMLDDDLDFAVRRSDEPTKFRPAGDEDIHRMLEVMVQSLLEGYPLVGISAREGANYDTSQFKYNTRQMRVHGIKTDFFRDAKIRFDRMEFMEDFDVILQLLEMGFTNRVLNGWVHNQRGGSNAPGGCSSTRTLERHNEAAKALQQLHPKYVTLVNKAGGNWGGDRIDVRIAWKKAFEDGCKKYVYQVETELP